MADPLTILNATAAVGAAVAKAAAPAKEAMSEYKVMCLIEMENWTKYILSKPHVKMDWGVLEEPPSLVLPSRSGQMLARKTSGTATGTSGTASWLIEGTGLRLVVMWSAPFNFDFHSNYLAVGIASDNEVKNKRNLFDVMYNKKESWFLRRKFRSDIRTIEFSCQGFEVEAIMGDTHKALAKIVVRPKTNDEFARPIAELF